MDTPQNHINIGGLPHTMILWCIDFLVIDFTESKLRNSKITRKTTKPHDSVKSTSWNKKISSTFSCQKSTLKT